MKGEWKTARLGDVADVLWGDTSTTKASYTQSGFPAYSASGRDGFLPHADFDRTGIVVSAIGAECGKTWLAKGKWSCIKNTLRFWSNVPEVDTEFLYWLTSNPEGWPKRGSAQPFISQGDARAMQITYPPLSEQRAIAAVLGALDDKIELNRRMNATLEGMARALFQSWFVDFDPVRAKLDGRSPEGMDAETAALFPEQFAYVEHEKLPVGWRNVAVEQVCAINGWTLGKNDQLSTIQYVEISEVSRGNISNIATYRRGEEPSRARRRLRHGDTVISTVRPDRGSYFLALQPPENRVASTGFAVLTPTKVPWSFLHAALTQSEVSDHLGQMADGGAYPAVRPEIIGAMQVALPNESKILEAFHRFCAPLFEQAEANRTQSRTLATLRDALLPKLLSGELSVADAKRQNGEHNL